MYNNYKVEIDTKPPAGAAYNDTLKEKYFLFAIRYHNLSSLFAGKIRAVITRDFIKGRDWYDIIWYLTRDPPTAPNVQFLQNALDQNTTNQTYAATEWNKLLLDRLKTADFQKIKDDVEPFLERRQDISIMEQKYLTELLQ
jgi:hypothetical protein